MEKENTSNLNNYLNQDIILTIEGKNGVCKESICKLMHVEGKKFIIVQQNAEYFIVPFAQKTEGIKEIRLKSLYKNDEIRFAPRKDYSKKAQETLDGIIKAAKIQSKKHWVMQDRKKPVLATGNYFKLSIMLSSVRLVYTSAIEDFFKIRRRNFQRSPTSFFVRPPTMVGCENNIACYISSLLNRNLNKIPMG